MIEEIINEINRLLKNEYPYSALGMALTIPDICGNIAYPKAACGERYIRWFNEYVSPINCLQSGEDYRLFDGEICFKLRCAYLHSGNFDLGHKKAVKDIERFTLHYSQDPELRFMKIEQAIDGRYQIDIDLGVLCDQLCKAAKIFCESHQSACVDITVKIKNETPSPEKRQEILERLEKVSGYTIEQLKEKIRQDRDFAHNLNIDWWNIIS